MLAGPAHHQVQQECTTLQTSQEATNAFKENQNLCWNNEVLETLQSYQEGKS